METKKKTTDAAIIRELTRTIKQHAKQLSPEEKTKFKSRLTGFLARLAREAEKL